MKKAAIIIATLIAGLVASGFIYIDQIELDQRPKPNKSAQASDIGFIANSVGEERGKILMVLTSTPSVAGKKSLGGYELTEVSRAYYVFTANGFDVDFANPKGGTPPANIDDLLTIDYAFLNDNHAQTKLENSYATADVESKQYKAVYFAGGKGTLLDFPEDAGIHMLTREIYEQGGQIAAVCHGPAALVNVELRNGKPLVSGRAITGFTNEEELLLIPDARELFPFLLQDKLSERGANFQTAAPYTDNVVLDKQLISGQNPWSTWSVAEALIRRLGYQPLAREKTAEEGSIDIIGTYYQQGYGSAKQQIDGKPRYDRAVIMLHGIVAAMDWRLIDALRLLRLAAYK